MARTQTPKKNAKVWYDEFQPQKLSLIYPLFAPKVWPLAHLDLSFCITEFLQEVTNKSSVTKKKGEKGERKKPKLSAYNLFCKVSADL